ncbi:HNH endonuclease [Luteimonas sp. MJ250]|uniref:HNH endonuclease n=1 Tax=Luteimonas sp. MJ250 TaxID=3129236 RepID=UPI0031BA83AC
MLWGRAANRCAICRDELVMDASETDDESVVGEACHIVASSAEGPRGDSPLTPEQRDKYANLILLCNIHHKQIDDQFIAFSIERLNTLKRTHEDWVRIQLGFDTAKQRDDEFYAGIVDEWASRIDLDNWINRASPILCGGQPSIDRELLQSLEDIRAWLLSRHWPGRYPAIESAFLNFRRIAQDFCMTFNEHAVPRWETSWQTEKFYKIPQWDPPLYRRLSTDFDYHVSLVCDLMLELTRSVNYVVSCVRDGLMPSYRSKEGVALIQSGPLMDLSYRTYRVEYRGTERTEQPYPGMTQFKVDRESRDINFGKEPAEV